MSEANVTRVFDAPREQVWKAWTEPEHFANWYGTPPYTTPLSTISMDVRPGGEWRATMVHESDGSERPFRGTYREIVEPERLVFTYDDVNDPSNENVEVATVTFTDLGGKTEVVYHQVGHLPDEQYPQIEEGVSGFFDRLAEHLARA
ncbi:MAG: SRPBCC domain-containing protein [Actinobacteria bacterium]|nr:SRPBCC domain-containing protein [Actinomycetota bacterium]